MNMVKSVSRLAGRPHPSHICIGAGIYRVCACSSWPGLAHVLPRPGKIEIAARPARDGLLPGPLWPSHRAAEISDILAGSGWNLRRIGRTRLTDRMLILHDCVPLGWKPSVIWSASNFFFLPSFSSQCWKYHGESGHREPCLRTALYWRGNRHSNRYRPHCQASYIHYSSMVPGFSSSVHVGLSAQTGQATCSVKPYGYYCVHLQQRPWELESRRNGSLRDCASSQGYQSASDSFPNFCMPKNSKSPVQNVKQKVKTTFLDRLIQIIHSCRQGASCRLVVWSSHVGSMHMQSEEQEALFLQQQAA